MLSKGAGGECTADEPNATKPSTSGAPPGCQPVPAPGVCHSEVTGAAGPKTAPAESPG